MEESCLRFKVEKSWSKKKKEEFFQWVFSTVLFYVCEPVLLAFKKWPLLIKERERIQRFNAIDRGRHHDGYGPDHSSDRKFARIQPVKHRRRASRRNWPNARPLFCRHTKPRRLTYKICSVSSFTLPHVDYFELLITLHCRMKHMFGSFWHHNLAQS